MLRREDVAEKIVTDVDVAVCAYTMDRLELTIRCINAIRSGSVVPRALLVVVDNNLELADTLSAALPDEPIKVVLNDGVGISDARNTALELSSAEVVAFVDDDACPEPNWLAELLSAFEDDGTVGAGGNIIPEWGPGARVLPGEVLWIVGCIYRGHPEGPGPITRPIGANMALRRTASESVGGFDSAFGPSEGKKVSCNEELVLFRELTSSFGSDSVVYRPDAVVRHYVSAQRTTLRYLASRSWLEGRTKAKLSHVYGATLMSHDAHYARRVLLPATVAYFVRGILTLNTDALRAALCCGLTAVVTGTAYGLVRCRYLVVR